MSSPMSRNKNENDEEPEEVEMDINELITIVVKKLTQDGYPQTIEWLLKRGVSSQDAARLCEIATHILARHAMEQEEQKSQQRFVFQKKDTTFTKGGHRLGSSGEDEQVKEDKKIISLYDNDELVDLYDKTNNEQTPKTQTTTTETTNNTEEINYKELVFDPNLPQTKLRVILIGGETKTIQINLNHTVKDLVEHIASVTKIPINKFKISFAYPKKAITDLEQTITTAKLDNSRIIQEKI